MTQNKIEKIIIDPIKGIEKTFLARISGMAKANCLDTSTSPVLRFTICETDLDFYRYKGYVTLQVKNSLLNDVDSFNILFFYSNFYDEETDFEVWKGYRKFCSDKFPFLPNLISTLVISGFKSLIITESKYRSQEHFKLDLTTQKSKKLQ